MNVYPDSLTVRPLTTWPGELTKAHLRKRSPFSAPLKATLTAMETELSALGARRPVLEVAIEPGGFRIDGNPRADAKAAHPGVVLSLPHTTVGPLRYAADRFETWQDNLRAIVLGLEALRKVERYGIVRRGEQYAGFKALPPGASTPEAMTEAEALAFLIEMAGWTVPPDTADPYVVDLAYRTAAKKLHPDAGGSSADFQRLEQAWRILRAARAGSMAGEAVSR